MKQLSRDELTEVPLRLQDDFHQDCFVPAGNTRCPLLSYMLCTKRWDFHNWAHLLEFLQEIMLLANCRDLELSIPSEEMYMKSKDNSWCEKKNETTNHISRVKRELWPWCISNAKKNLHNCHHQQDFSGVHPGWFLMAWLPFTINFVRPFFSWRCSNW